MGFNLAGLAKVAVAGAQGYTSGKQKALVEEQEALDRQAQAGLDQAKASSIEATLKHLDDNDYTGEAEKLKTAIDYSQDDPTIPATGDGTIPAPSGGLASPSGQATKGLAPDGEDQAVSTAPLMQSLTKFRTIHDALKQAMGAAPADPKARTKYLSGLHDMYAKQMTDASNELSKEFQTASLARNVKMARHGLNLLVNDSPDAVYNFYQRNGMGDQVAFLKGAKIEDGKVYMNNGKIMDLTPFMTTSGLMPNLTDDQIIKTVQHATDGSNKLNAQKLHDEMTERIKMADIQSKAENTKTRVEGQLEGKRIQAQATVGAAGMRLQGVLRTSWIPEVQRLSELQKQGKLDSEGTKQLATYQNMYTRAVKYNLDGSPVMDQRAKALEDGLNNAIKNQENAQKNGQDGSQANAQATYFRDQLARLGNEVPTVAAPVPAAGAATPKARGGGLAPKPAAKPGVKPPQKPSSSDPTNFFQRP